jgi:hypothetical protein
MSLRLRLAIVTLVFWVTMDRIQEFDWDRGIYRAMMMLVVLATLPILVGLVRRSDRPIVSAKVSVVLAIICTGLLCWHFSWFGQRFARAHFIDIGSTTLSAVNALLHGSNPYSLPIDPVDLGPVPGRYYGYKYLPMMALTFLPLSAIWQERGILLTNLLLDLTTVTLIFQLSLRISKSQAAGLFAALLYLALPLVPVEIFKRGVTDLAAIVPLLVALLCLEKQPGWAGLFLGLSVSTKLLPGAVFIPCCIPSSRRERYFVGTALGLMPALVFLFISPSRLIDNTVLFNVNRAVDSTSWLYVVPPEWRSIATVLFILVVLSVTLYIWFGRPTIADRCGLGVVCILGAMFCGPIVHRNYQLWWLPMFVVLLGPAAFQRLKSRS